MMNRHKIFGLIVVCFSWAVLGNLIAQETEPQQILSKELENTIITPVMEVPITPGKNLIYCSTFQIAWNMLQDSIVGEEIRMVDHPEVVDLLNRQLSTADDIDEDCYVAMVDTLTEEFLRRINDALKRKFGDNAPPEVKMEIIPDLLQIFSYAYLFKSLQFPIEFERFDYMFFRQNGELHKVESFGIEGFTTGEIQDEMRDQVLIRYYGGVNEYIVSLKSTTENDVIILAKIPSSTTLLETVNEVNNRAQNIRPYPIELSDALEIPVFDFNIKHFYNEVSSKYFLNDSWMNWFISYAMQWIRFKMDEKGVVLKSEAETLMVFGGPREFKFSPPFLVLLKTRGTEYPYFAMWVDNAELMVKYEETE